MEQEAPRRSTRRSTHRSKVGQKNAVDLSREPRFMQEWYPLKPWDAAVLTADPSSHLSHRASSGIRDETMKGYGGVCAVKEVWSKVPDSVKCTVMKSCLSPLLQVALSIDENNRVLVRGLMALFWDTTNTFHMPHCEMTITPLDFSMSVGVSFGGNDVIYDRDFGSKTDVLQEMYGSLATEFPTDGSRSVSYSIFSGVFDDAVFMCTFSDDQLARCFITYSLSATIFADRSNKTWFHYLPCLRDLSRMGEYNWGVAGYANLLQHLRRACRVKDKSNLEHFTKASIGGFWNVLEVLTLPTADYKAFREMRLAPPIRRCEIRCRVRLPEPCVKVRGVNGEETFVEIPDHPDPVPKLPFPPDFKGFDRAESEKLWRLLHSSMRRVAELTSFVDLWTSAPRLSVMGSCPSVGSTHFPQRLSELERLLSVASSLQQQNASKGEPSRKRRLVRQQTIESDSESDKSVG